MRSATPSSLKPGTTVSRAEPRGAQPELVILRYSRKRSGSLCFRCGHVGLLRIDPAENGLPCPWLFGVISHPPASHASYCVLTRMDLPAGPPTTFPRTRQMRDMLMAGGSKLIVSYVPQRTVASYKEEGGK